MRGRWRKETQQLYPLHPLVKDAMIAELDAAYCLANAMVRIEPMAVSPRQDWINAHNERKEQENQE